MKLLSAAGHDEVFFQPLIEVRDAISNCSTDAQISGTLAARPGLPKKGNRHADIFRSVLFVGSLICRWQVCGGVCHRDMLAPSPVTRFESAEPTTPRSMLLITVAQMLALVPPRAL